jgi:hypothetical protein
MIAIVSCKKEGKYNLTETPPISFSTNPDGHTVIFKSDSSGVTNISWTFEGSDTPATGETVTHFFDKYGNYLVTMTGTKDGVTYTYRTVINVAKGSKVRLNDNTFADWNYVTDPDFIMGGSGNVVKGKVDFDPLNIYFFVEYVTTGLDGNGNLDNHVMDLYMDSDGDITTGFSAAIGADYLFEGNLKDVVNPDYPLIFTGAAQSDWSWGDYTKPNATTLGFSETVGDTVRFEFAISREVWNINKPSFAFKLDFSQSNYTPFGSLIFAGKDRIVMDLTK